MSEAKDVHEKTTEAALAAGDDMYVVVTTTYPTTYGCHQGMSWSRVDMIHRSMVEVCDERLETRDEAVELARTLRDEKCEFVDFEWDEEPPWDSAEVENYDNDEEILIEVMTKGEYNAKREEDKKCLEKVNLQRHFEQKVKTGIIREQAKANKGRAFYSIPRDPSLDIPAELELKDTSELSEVLNKDLASIKSLRYEGGKKWRGSLNFWYANADMTNKKQAPPDVLLEVLAKCIYLEELHLYLPGSSAVLSAGYFKKINEVAPHLADTLIVLSFPFTKIHPDALYVIAHFSKLEHLDMSNSLSTEFYQFGDTDFDPWVDGEILPYDDPLCKCVAELASLAQLDLGNGDTQLRRPCKQGQSCASSAVRMPTKWEPVDTIY